MTVKINPGAKGSLNIISGIRRVCVMGLGTVGLPTAVYISKFFPVIGYDIKKEAAQKLQQYGSPATTSWADVKALEDIDVFVICVSTGLTNDLRPDVRPVYDCCEKIASYNKDALVCVESTIVPGTCRAVSEEYGLRFVVHCPHRYWVDDPERYGVRQLRVFGALNEEARERGLSFYRALSIPLHEVEPIEVAELCKVAENAYRFVQIAFAEELKIICDKLGLSFEDVRAACNTKWNIEILEAREGIGRHCLPKDIHYLMSLHGDTPLLRGAVEADELYRRHIQQGRRC